MTGNMHRMLTALQVGQAMNLKAQYKNLDLTNLFYGKQEDFYGRLGAQIGIDLVDYGTDYNTTLARTNTETAKDVMIPPGGSAPIISAPAGTFILDPQDTILAGTDPSLQNPPTSAAAETFILDPSLQNPTTVNNINNNTPATGDNLSAVMLQVGRMIVAAVNSKGSGVFGATTMNSGYY